MHTCTTLPAYLNIKIQNICIIGHDFANCKNSVFIFYFGNTFIKANCHHPLLLNGVLKPFVAHLYLKPSLPKDIHTELENLTKSIYAQQRILYSQWVSWSVCEWWWGLPWLQTLREGELCVVLDRKVSTTQSVFVCHIDMLKGRCKIIPIFPLAI